MKWLHKDPEYDMWHMKSYSLYNGKRLYDIDVYRYNSRIDAINNFSKST